uniref:Uncharacterized protein n=1 Tax=uncultured prokaryote TaxID=198431 RepID=A0A0H5QQ24_9ZZZZ|nr:hypothetical protein [uncultured prokaryote]
MAVKVSVTMEQLGRTCVNTFAMEQDENNLPAAGDKGGAELVFNHWRDYVMDKLVADCVLKKATLHLPTPIEEAGSEPGGWVSPAAAVNLTYLVNKVAATGRSGRFYIPGVGESAVDGAGNVTSLQVGQMTTQMELFRTNLLADGWVMIIEDKDGFPHLIESLQCQGKCATQRRRMRS